MEKPGQAEKLNAWIDKTQHILWDDILALDYEESSEMLEGYIWALKEDSQKYCPSAIRLVKLVEGGVREEALRERDLHEGLMERLQGRWGEQYILRSQNTLGLASGLYDKSCLITAAYSFPRFLLEGKGEEWLEAWWNVVKRLDATELSAINQYDNEAINKITQVARELKLKESFKGLLSF